MSLREFLGKLGIKPREMLFYEQAFTHPSFTNKKGQTENYQRLEFLGDAIISLYVARRVYRLTPPLSEGKMSILKASVVSWANLGALARKLNFQNQIRFAPKAQDLGQNEKILSDVFEAFIAALYLDKGSRSSNHFLDRVLSAQIAGLQGQELKNPKTLLQEYLQRQQARAWGYKTTTRKAVFYTRIECDGRVLGRGKGKTRQQSEVEAARQALERINREIED